MEMSDLSVVIPRPLRDVGFQIHSMYKADEWSTSNEQFKVAAKTLAVAAMRMALAGIAFVAISKYECSYSRTTVAGAIVSLPVTLIGWGSKLLCDGARSIYKNILTRSFKEAGIGLGIFTAGFVMLEVHNTERLRNMYAGFGDMAMTRMLRIDY
jgi:hypothetical protein